MSTIAAGRLTFEEFERLPDYVGRQELLRGELIQLPPPIRKHNEIAEELLFLLRPLLRELHASGKAKQFGKAHIANMGYRLENDGWVIPDVSITHAGQAFDGKYYLGSPAIAIEVISNEKTADYISTKIEEYFKHGALEVWVVFPTAKNMWIYRPDGTWQVCSGVFQSTMLAGASIDLNAVFE